jgi:glycosyltransferase involved in cell wall biosynthesis
MISFIIPAHDEEQLIGATLAAIHAAAAEVGEPYEIIVVADACSDRTAEIAREAGARVVEVAHRKISATRNSGAREAQGEVFFFIDADTRINAQAVRRALAALDQGAVGGGCVFRFDGRLPFWSWPAYPLNLLAGHLLKLVGGCCLFCTRAAFDMVGGFSEEYFASEELAFTGALKRHGRFVVPRATVVTSGRKLRTFSLWHATQLMWRFVRGGADAFRTRDGLEIWYGPRRHD